MVGRQFYSDHSILHYLSNQTARIMSKHISMIVKVLENILIVFTSYINIVYYIYNEGGAMVLTDLCYRLFYLKFYIGPYIFLGTRVLCLVCDISPDKRMDVWRRITRLPHKRLQIHLCVEMQRINGTPYMRQKGIPLPHRQPQVNVMDLCFCIKDIFLM